MLSFSSIGALLLAVAIPVAVGFIGTAVGGGGDSDWYRQLNKPSWTPPDWVFPVMWTALYILMGVSSWLVWKQGGFSQESYPLGAYCFQLALNFMWTPIFFGMKRPVSENYSCSPSSTQVLHICKDFAFVEIVILWLAVAVTIYLFWPVNAIASMLLVPYILWVTVAASLNWYIWMYNGNGSSEVTQPLRSTA